MKRITIIAILLIFTFQVLGQEKYFVSFKDKLGTPYTIGYPEQFLSSASIQRRERQSISINETDLPVSPQYLHQLEETGAKVLYPLKWFNGAVLETYGAEMINQILGLESVLEVVQIFEPGIKGSPMPEEDTYTIFTIAQETDDYYFYGSSSTQIKMMEGHSLHNNGFRGEGMTIAVLDAGFYKANTMPSLQNLWDNGRVIFTRDFVNPNSDIFEEHAHGMLVLSVLAGDMPGQLIGSAPEANYILIRSEDANSEQIIEEYNWAAAAELADSLGADIINSSLGYSRYDAPWQSHSYLDMDGKTTPAAKAANFAGNKGILVVSSAGNEGSTEWKNITTPADALNALAIGAVNSNGEYVYFSSIGPSADGRIKPDVVAMGSRTVAQVTNGQIAAVNGTSFSAPLVAGLAACLWQSNPNLTVKEIAQRIIRSSNTFTKPNNFVGYGIPNFSLAMEGLPNIPQGKNLHLFPNPTNELVSFWLPSYLETDYSVGLYTITGTKIKQEFIPKTSIFYTLNIPEKYPPGLYIVKLMAGVEKKVGKVIKISP